MTSLLGTNFAMYGIWPLIVYERVQVVYVWSLMIIYPQCKNGVVVVTVVVVVVVIEKENY